jgi:hypothetical protein
LKIIKKNTGYTAILFAAINISLGVFYAVFHWVWILTWFAFLGASVLVYIGIETKLYMNYSKNITGNSSVLNNNDYDDNINLNESKANLSIASSNQNLSEHNYSISHQTTIRQNDRESSFTTLNSLNPSSKPIQFSPNSAKHINFNSSIKQNSFSPSSASRLSDYSPQTKLNMFDKQAYEQNLKNEKRILSKIQQRNEYISKKG